MNKIQAYYKEPSYIHYSNCHEDADFALRHIKGQPRSILTVASGLDNALAFLLLDPESVAAIDYNDTQIHLCRLKKCGIEHLDYDAFLTLIGMKDGDSRAVYEQIKEHLDEGTRSYFDEHLFLIAEVGLVNCGRFEYYFQVFKKHILTKTHSHRTVERFMTAPDLPSQRSCYQHEFNNLRFNLLFRLFFSKAVMKCLGRDKDYFTFAKGSLADRLKSQFEICVNNNLNTENPYLQYIVQGRMTSYPCYLQKEHYEKIKANISRLDIQHTTFDDAVKSGNHYDFMYLSDIFEYMSADRTRELSGDIYRALNDNGQVMLYNMMIERHLSGSFNETRLDQASNRTFYYMNCFHYEKE